MRIDLDDLPSDPALLQRLVRDLVADKVRHDGEIDNLRLIIKQLQRHQFGRRSEKLDPGQLALGFEDLDATSAGPRKSRANRNRRARERTRTSPYRAGRCQNICRATT